jgi:type IV pilus assembly protein PilM
MFLHNPFTGAFGLNIGDSSIKLIQLSKKAGLKNAAYYDVENIREVKLPVGCVAKGEIQQQDLVIQNIKALLNKTKKEKAIKVPYVVGSLPVTKSFLKLIEIESTASQLTKEMVSFEMNKHLPMDIKDVYFDWQIVEPQKNSPVNKILVGAVPKNIVDSYSDTLTKAGLYPLALEMEDLSIARAMITFNKSYHGEARAILDLGSSRSSIIIYDKGSVQFSSLISICGDVVDTALIQNLKTERKIAEELKKRNGITYDPDNPTYLKTIDDLIDKLAEEIKHVLSFYKNHYEKANPVTHITLSGGLSATKNLDKVLSKKIGVDTYPGNAWKNLLNKNLKSEERFNGLPLASAIGLALRASNW